jgi:protein-tyrosine phosphatase
MPAITYDKIAPNLYQGSRPEPASYDFVLIVLMAEEYQPKSVNFPGTKIIHAPILDNPWGVTVHECAAIEGATKHVVEALKQGEKVLVTCNMGLNRSGVVVGLALRRFYPQAPVGEIIASIRHARGPHALSNIHFERLVKRG